MDNTEQSCRIISLCTGIRGLELGLERAGIPIREICFVEAEAFIIANLVSAMEAGFLAPAPIWTGLASFDASPFRGKIHGIVGGYPCQPFSKAGLRNGIDDPRHLFPYIEKCIAAARPIFCFFENVSDHLTMGYPDVSESLRNLGYRVEAGLFTAEEVGSPQERERIFILAVANTKGAEFQSCIDTWRRNAGHTDHNHELADLHGLAASARSSGLQKKASPPKGKTQVGERGRGEPGTSGTELADPANFGIQGLWADEQPGVPSNVGEQVPGGDGVELVNALCNDGHEVQTYSWQSIV